MAISYLNDVRTLLLAEAAKASPRMLELSQTEPDTLAALEASAWLRRDRASLIAIGQATRHLGVGSQVRAAHALLSLGQPAAALTLLDETGSDHLGVRAEALAALGRFDDALQLGERLATESHPPRNLEVWRRLAAGPQSDGAPDRVAFAGEARSVGAMHAAASAITPLIMSPKEAPLDTMIAVLALALETLMDRAALEVGALITRLRTQNPTDDALWTLELEWRLRTGDIQPICDQRRWLTSHPTVHRLRAEALARNGQRDLAAFVLGTVVAKTIDRHETRGALARVVGENVLGVHPPQFAERPDRRVINIVPYNGELGLLKLRMHEMAAWVDCFVIVEARQTFTGIAKPAHFEAVKGQFAGYGDKLRHLVLDEFPSWTTTAWARDFWQRDMAIKALDRLWAPQDVVLLTDADEIVRHSAIRDFHRGVLALKMRTYRYFLNYAAAPGSRKANGHTGAICSADLLARYGASYIRFFLSRADKVWDAISDAGWHFTSVGDAVTVRDKFAAYAHQEHADLQSEDRIARDLASIRAGDYEAGWAPTPIDASFPAYLRERPEEFGDLILPT